MTTGKGPLPPIERAWGVVFKEMSLTRSPPLDSVDPVKTRLSVPVLTFTLFPVSLASTEPKMPKRLSYLLSVLSLASTSADRDTPQTIRDFIATETTQSGKRRSIIRRDLILQNGYHGAGAQAAFAVDLHAALEGDSAPLLSHLHERDHEAVVAALPIPVATPSTAVWLEQQCREKNLHVRLAASLKRDFRAEEYTECLSFAGLWIARWRASGSFDKVLAAEGTVRFGVMMTFLKRKHYSAIFVRGAEPLHRLRGARTQHEIRMRAEVGQDFLCHDATQSSDWETAWEGDSEDGSVEEIVVSPSPTPEEELSGAEDAAFIRRAGASLVRAAHRGAADRYERVYDAIMDGATREEVGKEIHPRRRDHSGDCLQDFAPRCPRTVVYAAGNPE
jgi:hypothetical protein